MDVNHLIPVELQTVSKCAEHFGTPGLFAEVNVILAQHLVGDLLPFVRALQSLGLRRELCWVLDIPYASNSTVRKELLELGLPEDNVASAVDFSPLEPYQPTQYFRASSLFRRAIATGMQLGAKRTVIIDDGGHSAMARFAINAAVGKGNSHPVIVVEQTGHGMKLHRQVDLPNMTALINVAESPAKLKYESPVIAQTVVRKIKRLLNEVPLPFHDTDKLMIFGYGSVGKAVTQRLIADLQISEERLIIKPEPREAFYTLENGQLSGILDLNTLQAQKPKLVIGCTGEQAFLNSHISLLNPEALLISASSGTVEFPRDEWIAVARNSTEGHITLSRIDELLVSHSIHQVLAFRINGNSVFLANSGYPVNFEGEVNSSPPDLMQLTVSLMLTGAIRATEVSKYSRGELRISHADERWIVDTFHHSLATGDAVKYK
jgi:S-adenosylhomocysteine hydrolase